MVNGEALTILLVEDNMSHAKLVMRGLKKHKVANNIDHVSDGEMALDYLYKRGEFSDLAPNSEPHVVLLDLRLPKVDGLDVLKTIKTDNKLKHIPVVILTTSEAEKDVVTAYGNYANAYLTKPLDFDKFSQQMTDLGFFWLCWNIRQQAEPV